MFISMQRQTGSKNDQRLAHSLAHQRRLDALRWDGERQAAETRERLWGNNDMSGKQSLMKAVGSPPRVTRLTSWVDGIPVAPWRRDNAALTARYAPKSRRAERPAYATV